MKLNKNNSIYQLYLSCNGGVPFRILLILFTLLLIGGSLFFMLENQKKRNKIDHREAMKCSDYGFQALGETFSEDEAIDPEKIKGIEKREHEGGWYTVNVSKSRNNNILSIIIESEGKFGTQSAVQKKTIQFKRSVLENSDSVWVPVSKN